MYLSVKINCLVTFVCNRNFDCFFDKMNMFRMKLYAKQVKIVLEAGWDCMFSWIFIVKDAHSYREWEKSLESKLLQ